MSRGLFSVHTVLQLSAAPKGTVPNPDGASASSSAVGVTATPGSLGPGEDTWPWRQQLAGSTDSVDTGCIYDHSFRMTWSAYTGVMESGVLQRAGEVGDTPLVKDAWRTFCVCTLADGPGVLSGGLWASLRQSIKCFKERQLRSHGFSLSLYFNHILRVQEG